MGTSIRHIGAAYLLAALTAPTVACAQIAYPVDLPAQKLSDSLRELGNQAQIDLIYDPEALKDRRASALKGSYELKAALAKLLDGTGFRAEFLSATSVSIKPISTSPKPPRRSPGASNHRTDSGSETASLPARLDTVSVLGSLLPRAQVENASPLITITSEDIKNRGFSSVADALQNVAFNTGAINNTSINTSDIWAAKTVSLFGLDPSYTKFLIDGRPMPQFSQVRSTATVDQLYTNLTAIPIEMVERVEILPGGQSSLYGSDAIAGVINIVLKKHVDFGVLTARTGWYPSGGGRERLFSATNSFQLGKLNLMLGAQVNDQQPLWAFQRRITKENFAGGIDPQQANRIAYVLGFSGATYFPQPGDCDSLGRLWGDSVRSDRSARGPYCGTVRNGSDISMINKDQAASVSAHATYDLDDGVQLYADLIDSYEKQKHSVTTLYFGMIADLRLQEPVQIYRQFAPEEVASNLDGVLNQTNYENTYAATVGGKVELGSGWNLDAAFTRSYERSDNRQIGLLADTVPGSYGDAVLGPRLGVSDSGIPIYEPNYALLFRPLTPAEYASYAAAASILSNSRNDQLRAQLTQTSLFSLPGGDAGLAVVGESGFESWKYLPSSLLTSGGMQGIFWNSSGGRRNRQAAAAELNLPVAKMLTADFSTRYDRYDAEGARFSHPTFSLGLEFRPYDGLLLRSKYSTSFKAPSLIDQFEGGSTVASVVTDWANCQRLGYVGTDRHNCPAQYYYTPAIVIDRSNPHLQPLTARTFSYGVVWSPTEALSMSVDYQHISIKNEVLKESTDYLGKNELYCENGTLDPQSPTCQAVRTQIIRGPAPPGSPLLGPILQEVTSKINIARETNNAINASASYKLDVGPYGRLAFDAAYTRVLVHRQQTFPGDPVTDFLRYPLFSGTEFQYKGNLATTWSRENWAATLYYSYFGPTPNHAAMSNGSYDVPHAGRLPAWRIVNASLNYSPSPAWRLSLRINNLMNSMPPIDVTSPGYSSGPFEPTSYNPFGREIFAEVQYRFGHAHD